MEFNKENIIKGINNLSNNGKVRFNDILIAQDSKNWCRLFLDEWIGIGILKTESNEDAITFLMFESDGLFFEKNFNYSLKEDGISQLAKMSSKANDFIKAGYKCTNFPKIIKWEDISDIISISNEINTIDVIVDFDNYLKFSNKRVELVNKL